MPLERTFTKDNDNDDDDLHILDVTTPSANRSEVNASVKSAVERGYARDAIDNNKPDTKDQPDPSLKTQGDNAGNATQDHYDDANADASSGKDSNDQEPPNNISTKNKPTRRPTRSNSKTTVRTQPRRRSSSATPYTQGTCIALRPSVKEEMKKIAAYTNLVYPEIIEQALLLFAKQNELADITKELDKILDPQKS